MGKFWMADMVLCPHHLARSILLQGADMPLQAALPNALRIDGCRAKNAAQCSDVGIPRVHHIFFLGDRSKFREAIS